eukprot:gnl/TRDRNA2_/TRDRNA2_201510_c0_seq1.p1 gnl/TRDRNA2_/TRDRNA2_201510_c0~~gnl/TRDRNA2_/TRDRNA2_201510_c0_seq1.p1  ORF type:complete len:573 (-),score=94.91 gnl/TRDRNA2_/TRDRNA2_201510_c0_seq1:21-1739(-)
MASAASRFCIRTLEADVGLAAFAFLAPSSCRLAGSLRSSRVPSDLQRHEVGPDGEVLHLSRLGLELPQAPRRQETEAATSSTRDRRGTRQPQKVPGEPWAGTLYARGRAPAAARHLLAERLGVPSGALRTGPVLHSPGVSVQLVMLPRGLPSETVRSPAGELRSGLIAGPEPIVALGGGEAASRAVTAAALGRDAGSDGPGTSAKKIRQAARRQAWRCEGHRYTVVLRGLDARQCDAGLVEDSVDRLCEDGFVNFFELASFGFSEVRRYEVGAALWQGQWERAARLLLAMNWTNGEAPAAAASAAFRRGDLAAGVELLPDDGSADGLRTLAVELLAGRPALEALQRTVPTAVWGRYLGAVSKLAWNHAAAARLADAPHRPIMGDLVWDAKAGEARPLSIKEADSGELSLSDIVIPLPQPGEAVPECRGRLRLESILKRIVPEADAPKSVFPGSLSTYLLHPARRLVVVPSDVGWDIVEAGSGEVVECDLGRLGISPDQEEAAAPEPPTGSGGRRQRRRASAAAARDGLQGPALRLRFSLPRGSSGEAVLREVLRKNPSEFHAESLVSAQELF